jgi:hypothetical protein
MPTLFASITVRPDDLDDAPGARWLAQVVGMLHALDTLATSHAVLDAIRFYQKPVLLVPYDGQGGPCNAWAKRDWGMFRAKVSFTPFLPGPHSPCTTDRTGAYEAGDSPHESLVHELTHAVRACAGKIPLFSLSMYPDPKEEDIAMLVANIFSSETNRPLRARYEDNSAVSEDQAAYSAEYLADNSDLVAAFCKDHDVFARALGRVNAPFNPIRAYLNKKRPPGR